MFFFPYRADLEHWRLPLVTLLICAICLLVFSHQLSRKLALDASIIDYCSQDHGREFAIATGHLSTVNNLNRDSLCMYMLRTAHNSEVPDIVIKQWAFLEPEGHAGTDSRVQLYIKDILQSHYRDFSATAPTALTHKLWFAPDDIDVVRMITSVFAHNDIVHLLTNLFFFFAFAATVELVIGSLSLVASVLLLAILTNLFYAFVSVTHGVFVPTLGLSGIVFGMMGMFICFMPQANVRCFLWLFVVFKRFALPAWLIVLVYVCWNIYDWFAFGHNSSVNFIIHIAGAAFGYLVGVSIFRISKDKYLATSTARNVRRKYALGQASPSNRL